uniref:Uncharacterized protein n=1 Tax=Oryza brachyantha TaxID=4533 RepID=J3LW52_ORYBR
MLRDNRRTHWSSEEGISPDNWLLEKFRSPRLLRKPTSCGIEPEILLLERSKPREREDILTSSTGIDPSRMFTDKFSIFSLLHCPILVGMLPDKLLLFR